MTDLIKREDALALLDLIAGGEEYIDDRERLVAALPAVTVGVKPLVWHDLGFTYHAFDPIDGQTIHAETKEDIDRIEAERQQRILSALEPQPIDPAAIREAALREAALRIGGMIRGHDKTEYEEGYNDALATAERHIFALIGEKK